MIRATWDRLTTWWRDRGKPGAMALFGAWWEDLAENPKLHFISMVFGMFVLCAVKFAVWLVA